MKSSKIASRIVAGLLALSLPVSQSYAMERMTKIQIAAATGNTYAVIEAIDEQESALKKADEDLQAELNQGKTRNRKILRMQRRLSRGVVHAEREIFRKVDRMSDAEITTTLVDVSREQESRNSRILPEHQDSRTRLKKLYSIALQESIPQIAQKIVDAGGAIPFIVQTKSEILKSSPVYGKKSEISRDLASDPLCTLWFLGVLALSILFFALGLGTIAIAIFGVFGFPGGFIISLAAGGLCWDS